MCKTWDYLKWTFCKKDDTNISTAPPCLAKIGHIIIRWWYCGLFILSGTGCCLQRCDWSQQKTWCQVSWLTGKHHAGPHKSRNTKMCVCKRLGSKVGGVSWAAHGQSLHSPGQTHGAGLQEANIPVCLGLGGTEDHPAGAPQLIGSQQIANRCAEYSHRRKGYMGSVLLLVCWIWSDWR